MFAGDDVKLSATGGRAFSTFLLEMALDQERMKARVAEKLKTHRYVNGVRRYTQPEMCRRLGRRIYGDGDQPVNLRTYQHWEGGDVLPNWDILEAIADEIGITLGDLIGSSDAEVATSRVESGEVDQLDQLIERVEGLASEFAQLRRDVLGVLREDPPVSARAPQARRRPRRSSP